VFEREAASTLATVANSATIVASVDSALDDHLHRITHTANK